MVVSRTKEKNHLYLFQFTLPLIIMIGGSYPFRICLSPLTHELESDSFTADFWVLRIVRSSLSCYYPQGAQQSSQSSAASVRFRSGSLSFWGGFEPLC